MRALLAGVLLVVCLLGAAEPPRRATQVRYAMGTLYTVEAEGPAVESAIAAAFAEVRRLDALWSTYQPDSELSRVNRDAAKRWVPVSAETAAMLTRALGYARDTDGAFDPTVGPLVSAWGFKHQDYRVPTAASLKEAKQRVGFEKIQLDVTRGVRFTQVGVSLDLGAIAKGYAVDRALSVLKQHGMSAGRVDAGGNQGVFGRPETGVFWPFAVKHPRADDEVLGVITLTEGGISTSGDAERGFWQDGRRYGHILDPRTGRPVEGRLSVTVTAPSAEAADALSTALYVLGPTRGLSYLARRHPQARALFVEAGDTPSSFRLQAQEGLPWHPAVAGPSTYDQY